MNFLGLTIQRTHSQPVNASEGIYKGMQDIMAGKLDPALAEPILNAARKLAKKDPINFFSGFIKHQHYEYAKEISHWKLAIAEAKDIYHPRRVLLAELYNDIERDGFIWGLMTHKRILKISNRKFKITNASGELDVEKTKLLQGKWMNDFFKYAMQSKFHGFSLVYFNDWVEGRIKSSKLVWRTHVVPDTSTILKSTYDQSGFIFTQPPFSNYMVSCGDIEDLGIFEKAAPLWILKKHSWSSWDRFEELFGIPLRTVKTSINDKKVREEILGFLRDMGTANYGLFPQDTEIDIIESKQTDAYQVFENKINKANEELEVLITGNNRITSKNGSRAKEQVIQEDVDEVTADDKTFVANLVNDSLLPLLTANGYPFAPGDVFEWDDSKQLEPKERLEVFTTAKNLGFSVNREKFAQEFNIELDKVAAEPPPTDPPTPADKPTQTAKKIANMHRAIAELNQQ